MVEWNIISSKVLHGRAAVLQALQGEDGDAVVKLTVLHVMTHGKSGAVNGVAQYRDAAIGFCDVFEFANAKGTSVRHITSY